MKAKNELRQERIQVFDPISQLGGNVRTPDGADYRRQDIPFGAFGDIDFSPLPSLTIGIDEEKILIKRGSTLVENRIEERSIAEFTVVDIAGANTYQKGQPVEIFDLEEFLIFGGVIDTPEKIAMAPSGGLHHPIRCADWHYLADKRLVAESYEDKTCGYIVEDIFDKYLAAEGIVIGNIETGATLVEATFNYGRASDVLDALAEKTGKIWFIDENKRLYFQARDVTAAPWNWTTATPKPEGSKAHWSGGSSKYRNRQYIRGGKGTTTVEQVEKFVADGEQNAFTVSFPIAEVPSFIEVDNVDQTPVGIKGLDAPGDFKSYWAKGDPTITLTPPVPALGDIVEIKYYGQFDILVLVEDTDSIAARLAIEGGGTGYVDDIADEPTLNEKDAVIDSGQAKLARFTPDSQRFIYQAIERGLKPGQIQTVDYPLLGLNSAQMLIEAVSIRASGDLIIYGIIAIQGPESGSWVNFFKSLAAMKQEVFERLNVGSEQILIILVERAEVWSWDEDYTVHEATCPFPSATTYPATTLYPC